MKGIQAHREEEKGTDAQKVGKKGLSAERGSTEIGKGPRAK